MKMLEKIKEPVHSPATTYKMKRSTSLDLKALLLKTFDHATYTDNIANPPSIMEKVGPGVVPTTAEAQSKAHSWEKDFLHKINGDPTYLPSSIAEARLETSCIGSELADRISLDLKNAGLETTGTYGGFYESKGYYSLRLVIYQIPVSWNKVQAFGHAGHLLMPGAADGDRTPIIPVDPEDPGVVEECRRFTDKLAAIGNNPRYAELTERYCISSAIARLAAGNRDFAAQYSVNPRNTVIAYLRELKATIDSGGSHFRVSAFV